MGAPASTQPNEASSSPGRALAPIWCEHAIFLAYCIVAVLFYRERVLYDTSVFLNTGPLLYETFFRALDRLPVQIPPQLLPLLVVKLGGSSRFAAMAYSLNFALFHYCVWLLLAHGYRRRDLGVAFIVCLLLHLVHNNIFIQADLMHAAGYLFVFVAAAESPEGSTLTQRAIRWGSLLILTFLACFSHPLMIALTLYYAVYSMLALRRKDWALIVSTSLSVLLYVLNKSTFIDTYESGAIKKTFELSHLQESIVLLPNYLWEAHSPAIVLVAVFAFAVAFNARNIGIVILAILTMAALLLAVCSWIPLAEHSNWQFSGYTWMYFLSLYFVLVVPVFDENCAAIRGRISRFRLPLQSILCVVALAWSIAGTVLDFHLARERQAFIIRVRESLADVTPPIYLLDSQFSTNPLLRENDLTLWDDSLLVSSYDGPSEACMVIPPYGWKDGGADQYRRSYLGPLNPKFFNIPPARKTNAHVLNSTVDAATLHAAALDLELGYPAQPSHLSYIGGSPEDYRRPLEIVYSVPVRLTNHGARPFPSRVLPINTENEEPQVVSIGYRWVLDGRTIAEDRQAEAIPIDVRKDFLHNVHVRRTGISSGAILCMGLFVGDTFVASYDCAEWPEPL